MATPKPDLKEFEALTELDELRRVVSDLQMRLRRSRSEKADLVEAVRKGAQDALAAFGPIKPVTAPKTDSRTKRAEVALWHLTDWQGAKVTSTYNTEVMRQRVMAFCDKTAQITEMQRAVRPVKEAVILFGGDMIEGLFNFPSQPFEIDSSLFGQFADVARLEADVVRRALAIYEHVTVIGEWGNHGRVGSKRSAVPRSDNIDRMTYALALQILAGEDRLIWDDSPEDIQHVEIGNYRALLIHGDEIGRNGFASPMTMVNHVAKWKSGAHPWPFRDCYVGHYHNHSEWSLPDGEGALYQTGSPESDNRYARDTKASAGRPTQRLHFIDHDRGRVAAQFKVWLED